MWKNAEIPRIRRRSRHKQQATLHTKYTRVMYVRLFLRVNCRRQKINVTPSARVSRPWDLTRKDLHTTRKRANIHLYSIQKHSHTHTFKYTCICAALVQSYTHEPTHVRIFEVSKRINLFRLAPQFATDPLLMAATCNHYIDHHSNWMCEEDIGFNVLSIHKRRIIIYNTRLI